MKEFVALDVETANQDRGSICSIGAALFEDGVVADTFYSLVDPKTQFSFTWLHGISESDVNGMPTFPEILPEINEFVGDRRVVCHSHFDRTAFRQAATQHRIQPPSWDWLDSVRVARRAWPELAGGHGLSNLCANIGYEFEHHHALEDAKACGEVILAAKEFLPEVDLGEVVTWPVHWRDKKSTQIRQSKPRRSKRTTTSSSLVSFAGVVVVFSSQVVSQQEGSLMARQLGAQVSANLTGDVNVLVVGDHELQSDIRSRNSQFQHARSRQSGDQAIYVLAESDFREFGNAILNARSFRSWKEAP